jgi:hypothetical protein
MIPITALDPLEELAEQTLVHRAQLKLEVVTRQPGMKDVVTYVDDGPPNRPCLAVPAEAGGVNVRADAPTPAGDWAFYMLKGTNITGKHRAVVTGEDDEGNVWTKTLAIRKVLWPRAHEVLRECIATEVP